MSAPYHYTECGLDNVYLLNGFEWHDTPYGAGVSIENVDELHKAIALDLIEGKRDLNGKEIRFLRKELDLSQEGLAQLLGYTAQTVARWEKGECEVPGAADRLLRLIYLKRQNGDPDIEQMLSLLAELDVLTHEQRVFEETDTGWRSAA